MFFYFFSCLQTTAVLFGLLRLYIQSMETHVSAYYRLHIICLLPDMSDQSTIGSVPPVAILWVERF